MSVREALYSRLDITALSRPLVEKYANLIDSGALRTLLADPDEKMLQAYCEGRDILDLVTANPPTDLSPQAFVGMLRRLPARLYSIASSLTAHPGQVHLTVGAVRYQAHGRNREGVCSTFLADRLGSGEPLGVFVQINKNFRLPTDGDTPIVMVGPGTGIAPFRAFVEEREAAGAKGKNWLFFGDQHRQTDFLYREEWEDKLARGVLTKLDLAFSRDQANKVYVQTRMLENAAELYAWLRQGAYFYVCGDASRMAADVHEALHQVVMLGGGMDRDRAEVYVAELTEAKRYQRDVY
jgi:sulfite reductase (NADPH) flavoprotein alpha-component